jgi:AcrR family transcriptional regulator
MAKSRTVKPVEERRQEILSAARALFTSKGYRNTSVADIAQRLDIAQGLIFHYFKSKATLLYSVFDEIAAEKQQEISTFISEYPGRAIDCLGVFFDQNQHFSGEDILYADLIDDPAVHEYLTEKVTRIPLDLVVELIKRGNLDGSWHCDYPQETAVFLIHGISATLRIITEQPPDDIEGVKRALHDILFRLLGVDVSTLSGSWQFDQHSRTKEVFTEN